MVSVSEIEPGLVLHLDPRVLEQRGGTATGPAAARVRGTHFFICLSIDGSTGQWLPCFSHAGAGRLEVPAGARTGHAKWTDGTCWFHPAQVWTVTHQAVIAAAQAAPDQSAPGFRSYADLDSIEGLPL